MYTTCITSIMLSCCYVGLWSLYICIQLKEDSVYLRGWCMLSVRFAECSLMLIRDNDLTDRHWRISSTKLRWGRSTYLDLYSGLHFLACLLHFWV